MSNQALVIGLGQFGRSLAISLAQHGTEVLAVDQDEGNIASILPHVSDAILLDAMDEESLASLAPDQRDVSICAIGDDSREASIIVTTLLKQLGAPRILARATDDLHARILALVGADEVINPERTFGERLATRLARKHVLNVMPLDGGLVLTELEAPESFWGRTLAELQLPKRYHVTVSALRHRTDSGLHARIPDPHQPIKQGDSLLLVSTEDDAVALSRRV